MSRSVPFSFAKPEMNMSDEAVWYELNRLANGNPEFKAIEIKGLYVIGLLWDICKSVEWLLKANDAWSSKYLPAISLFTSGIDLFGRCLTGNSKADDQGELSIGLYYLGDPSQQPPPKVSNLEIVSTIVTKTNYHYYTVSERHSLRHYTQHGQASIKTDLPTIDIELLDSFPRIVGHAIGIYWAGLQSDIDFCERLAAARITPYKQRAEPITNILNFISKPDNSIEVLFYSLDWQVYK